MRSVFRVTIFDDNHFVDGAPCGFVLGVVFFVVDAGDVFRVDPADEAISSSSIPRLFATLLLRRADILERGVKLWCYWMKRMLVSVGVFFNFWPALMRVIYDHDEI